MINKYTKKSLDKYKKEKARTVCIAIELANELKNNHLKKGFKSAVEYSRAIFNFLK
jgi:hypothetical protein